VIPTYRRFLEILPDYNGWDRVEDLISPRSSPGKLRRRAASKAAARALNVCAERAGIDDLYPHRLRRTYAVEYLRAMKTDPEAVVKLQQHMQWASLATAMQYVDHHRGAELDVAAEAMWAR
jgi:integrase